MIRSIKYEYVMIEAIPVLVPPPAKFSSTSTILKSSTSNS